MHSDFGYLDVSDYVLQQSDQKFYRSAFTSQDSRRKHGVSTPY